VTFDLAIGCILRSSASVVCGRQALVAHTLCKHAGISAGVYNLLGKRYSFPGRPEDPEDSIRQDGTTFRVKLTYLGFGKEHGEITTFSLPTARLPGHVRS